MGNQYIVKKLGLEKDVIKLRATGLGASMIAQTLNRKKGLSLSKEVIQKYMTDDEKARGKIILEEKGLRDKVIEGEMDLIERMRFANKKLLEALKDAEKDKDRKHWRGIIGEMRKWLELQAKLSGQLQSATLVQFNQTNVTVLNDFRGVVFDVLADYPGLRDEIEKRLHEKEND